MNYADGGTVTFAYDAGGRLTSVADSVSGTIGWDYDALNRVISETTSRGPLTYSYDQAGRRVTRTVAGEAPVSYTYDGADRLLTITEGALVVNYTYDAANRRAALTLPNGVSTEYQYDASSRLTALIYRNATGTLGDLAYQYDPGGNRISIGGSFARSLLPDAVASGAYDVGNRQLAFGPKSMTFDANGNLRTATDGGRTITYTWNARDQLVALTGPGITATFAYDAVGRRATATVNSEHRVIQYEGVELAREAVGQTEVSYLAGPGIDAPLARLAPGISEYYILDALGSVLALTDAAGQVQTNYSYSPFGKTIAQGTPTASRLGFTAREDDGTGLYYYRARFYQPDLHRFISEDPIRLGGNGPNFYAYVGNNPTARTDPYGLFYTWAHEYLSTEILRACGFSEADIQVANRTHRLVDSPFFQTPLHDYVHAMPGNKNVRKSQQFVEQALAGAIQAELQGDRPRAIEFLTAASHTVQDKWSHAFNTPPAGWPQHMPLDPSFTNPDDPNANPAQFRRARLETILLVKSFLHAVRKARGNKVRERCNIGPSFLGE